MLDEFYKNLRPVGVSAVSGAGMKISLINPLKQVLKSTWKAISNA